MCYGFAFEITLQRDTAAQRARWALPSMPVIRRTPTEHGEQRYQVYGEFPTFHVSDGYCGCGFVGAKEPVREELVRALFNVPNTKRVRVVINYNIDEPLPTEEVRMELADFCKADQEHKLEVDHWYRITDKSRYQ